MNVAFGADGGANAPEVEIRQRPVADFSDAGLCCCVFDDDVVIFGLSLKPLMGVKTDSPPG